MSNETIGNEIEITEKDMIVSTTDKTGKIIYANDIFCRVAGYTRKEVIGQPHNMIRHPEMPKVVFKLLWERVLKGEVIYAFVKNEARNKDYYWVKAYVKPILENGEVVKITSYRKPLNEFAKKTISALYDTLNEYEKTHSVDESMQFFLNYLKERNLTYDQFIDRLSLQKNVDNISIRNVDFNKQKNQHIIFKEYVISSVKSAQFDELESNNCSIDEFGKWCESVRNESFVSDNAWKEVVFYHDKFHSTLTGYIQKAKQNNPLSELNASLHELDSDIDNIFNNLTIIRDKY